MDPMDMLLLAIGGVIGTLTLAGVIGWVVAVRLDKKYGTNIKAH
ncbi:TPA: hypothetical protein ACGR4O_004883 [Pseudomonas aeruginosa]|jgi:hypothetical protein|uniref:Uncharacterized protein n=1 Tax=Pseudomonas aeruginosa TaxID=287 RepID=A0A6C0L3U3_PSEAI|nr:MULTISPECIES: hypothetical protein [Pseudomonas aeruginosa group]ERX93967.1 hypothetical protein Q077_06498 [Pseudomonas aeruginosa BL23]MCS7734724.1 hypothetical protein [Pseudomonas aeruginosa]MCS8012104.1 hypothetical protein [Pseudomonas aeruginosa]MCS8088106.1 hypothetical protein [Pseudomonas aeruginosa]MCS8982303.1 hypothetical protein [Pseudomonas aeruginosa]